MENVCYIRYNFRLVYKMNKNKFITYLWTKMWIEKLIIHKIKLNQMIKMK